ncbi:MAG: L-threonylcarbamoyladenylate synthase [Bacteroidales bacterium]|nr:L-threonylcarbamoyladenylate synthase [Bacteroidales bacterium]MDT8374918.1 L-threonylcarbamoyladenylate synthase [Bacteroidales bacterium]
MEKEYEDDIRNALRVLRDGGVILYPTDTVWGLGCDPANGEAVRRIGEIKQRIDKKGMIILVNSLAMLTRYVVDPPDVALQMAEWSESPLTVIYDSGRGVADGVAADDGSLAVRLCSDPFCDDLITAFRKPLVSTSANVSGTPAPAFFDEIAGEIKSTADYVCLWRQDDRSSTEASSVIKVSGNGVVKILRD